MARKKDFIINRRKNLQMTQQEVAERIGIERTTYTNFELGYSGLSSDNIIKLAKLFSISSDAILGIDPLKDINLFPQERYIIENLRKLPKHKQKWIFDFLFYYFNFELGEDKNK